MKNASEKNSGKAISEWLFCVAAMVLLMAVIGAITRLTDSGLSMTEWRPLLGWVPPLTPEEWDRIFALYQASPEFQQRHAWMALEDFKRIFFWEWFHRLWGRLIGLAYGLPLLWFTIRRQIPKGYALPLLGILLLGAGQGVMGWIMVQSGLVDVPHVSHYRLAAHLGLAFILFSCLLWCGLRLYFDESKVAALHTLSNPQRKRLHAHGSLALGMLGVTIIWGAFVAGLDAGLIYNEFPKMGDHWYPLEYSPEITPVWMHLLQSHGWVQFAHRWMALLSGAALLSFWLHARLLGNQTVVMYALAAMTCMQIGLGIATLLTQVALPLAVLHQAGAFILTGLLLVNLFFLRKNQSKD